MTYYEKNIEIIPTNTKHGPREMLVNGHGPVIYPVCVPKLDATEKEIRSCANILIFIKVSALHKAALRGCTQVLV